jgi:hypothetical protein
VRRGTLLILKTATSISRPMVMRDLDVWSWPPETALAGGLITPLCGKSALRGALVRPPGLTLGDPVHYRP